MDWISTKYQPIPEKEGIYICIVRLPSHSGITFTPEIELRRFIKSKSHHKHPWGRYAENVEWYQPIPNPPKNLKYKKWLSGGRGY